MASFDPKVFTRPDGLKRITNDHLLAFLAPYQSYLAARGFTLPADPALDFPHEELAKLLMQYDDNIPPDLVNGLYYIDEVASNETLEDMMERANDAGISVSVNGKSTSADVATQIWNAKPDLLIERAVRSLAFQKSSFMYFVGKMGRKRKLPATPDPQLRQIETLMDPWFESKQRGKGARVFAFPRTEKVWLLIRHGMPMIREGKHEDDGSSGVAFYRPQKHDVVIYDADQDVLAVNADTKGARTLYRETIGLVLFGDKGYFGEGEIFTLAPIRDDGVDCLVSGDIDGIDRVRLREVVRVLPGRIPITEITRASDIFEALGDPAEAKLKYGAIVAAKFGVLFRGARQERVVSVSNGSARYDRDTDAPAVEAWLGARGFYASENKDDRSDADDDVLERD
ncbi:MAG: hypothetical protein ABF308_13635 [Phaeobacter gallaeciensis]